MAKSEFFENWLKTHSKNGYEDYVQIFPIKDLSTSCIGFHIPYKISDSYRHIDSFTVHGILCSEYVFSERRWEYYADIDYNTKTNEARLVDNFVKENVRRIGLGSLGLTYIKQFLKTIGCREISGVKHPIPNSHEEMAKLTAFYQKNGFENLASNGILYRF